MPSFDDFARLCTEEIRTAAMLDRAAQPPVQSSNDVAKSNMAAALSSISKLLTGMRPADQQRITELTAQRLGIDPTKLHNAFLAVSKNDMLDAERDIQYIVDEV
jgi:hypothetical protein